MTPKKKPAAGMTGKDLERERKRSGLGQIAFAIKISVNAADLRRWIANDDDVPDDVAERARVVPDGAVKKKAAKLRPDVAETAFRVMQEAIGEAPKTLPLSERTEKNPDAVARGSEGGKKGGKARAETLTERERTKSATIAALARWKKGN
jgi:hypothetical protein